MSDEFIFGKRVVSVHCKDSHGRQVCEAFFTILWSAEKKIAAIMDECRLPEHVIINFEEGDETLDGFYYLNSRTVSKHLTVIDIYTKQWRKARPYEREFEILHSFLHEIYHNKYEDEERTEGKAVKKLKEIKKAFGRNT